MGFDLDVASGHFSKELRRAQKNGQLPGPGGGEHYETPIDLTCRLDFRTSALATAGNRMRRHRQKFPRDSWRPAAGR